MRATINHIFFDDSISYRVDYPGGQKYFRFLSIAQMWCEVNGYRWEVA